MFSNYPSHYSNAIPTENDYKNTSGEWSSEDSIAKYSIAKTNKKPISKLDNSKKHTDKLNNNNSLKKK